MMPAVSFHYPQLLILLLLLPLVWRFLARGGVAVSSILRMALAVLAILALARPRLVWDRPDSDLIVLVDRSASCGGTAERMLREIWPLLKSAEGRGDRSAVVAFGDGALIERGFNADADGVLIPDDFEYASDLAAALRLASGMRSPDRRAAILCISDGLYTGENPLDAPAALEQRSLPFWYRRPGGEGGIDVAAGEIVLPEAVEPRSAWLVRYGIHSNVRTGAEYALSRNGLVIARGTVTLEPGANHFFARDTAEGDGMLQYRLDVGASGDVSPRNNRSIALLRVRGAPRALLVSSADEPGLLSRTLAAAAIPFDAVRPERFSDSPALLEPYRLIVLENCRLTDFPGRGVEALAAAVDAGLCSLLVTGGPNSFGPGGYHRSAVDPLLPVDLELRNEKRRGAMAIAIALDRSGSMAMDAGDGRTKMDLANLGAAESIRLLSPQDRVSVIAVDSSPHVIVPLSVADDVDGLARLTLGIQSMGGGIYCHAALKAAEEEIAKSALLNRHIVLFADAADAEDQEGCLDLAKRLNRDGIRISVIAMGTPADPDAAFLRDLARLGGGEALFSGHAGGLPALFTQEIMRISRRGFIEETVTPRLLPPMSMLDVSAETPPTLGGVNVSAAREGAVVYMNLNDEFAMPVLAARSSGRAETGAILFEVDGEYSGTFPVWPQAPELIVSLVRRLASGVNHARVKAYSGQEKGLAEARLEFSPDAARRLRKTGPVLKWLGPDGLVVETPLEWRDPETAVGRLALSRPGHYQPLADLGELGVAAIPPVSLPYAAEFAPETGGDGLAVLRGLADISGGGDGLDISEVRRSARAARPGSIDLRPYLLLATLLGFLLELSGRRLLWFR